MQSFLDAIRTIFGVFLDALNFIRLCFKPVATVAAENLFLRKQLGLYIERKVKPRRATDAIRFTLAQLSRLFDWRNALTIVKPDTLIRWHRIGFRLSGSTSPGLEDDLAFPPSCGSLLMESLDGRGSKYRPSRSRMDIHVDIRKRRAV